MKDHVLNALAVLCLMLLLRPAVLLLLKLQSKNVSSDEPGRIRIVLNGRLAQNHRRAAEKQQQNAKRIKQK